MPQTKVDWARGFALQALSDLNVREVLVSANAEKCHRLHFLQMAAEKICKAHVIMGSGYDSLKKTHAYVETVLPVIARQFYAHENARDKIAQWEIDKIKFLAGEIELICPACHAGKSREDNSEYPWLDVKGKVQIPCQYNFPRIDDGGRDIVRLIRLIRTAAKSYTDNA